MSTTPAASSTLMTEGPIWKKIITFAIPLFLGNLFQQLYNTADSLIVGNFLGSNSLAAVSSSGHLIMLMVGFFNGVSVGAGIVIARYYGARQIENVQKAIHTAIAFGLAAGLLLTGVGMALTPVILGWMGTPTEALPESISYFRTYFMGSLAFVMYNVFVGILQSVGDSRHPLFYLIISSGINVTLYLLFIGVFRFGVGAAAFATILSQFVSAGFCLRQLRRSPEDYRVSLKKVRVDLPMLRQILSNGLPAGFQNSIVSFANVIVQTNINGFGKMAVAGCGSYSKLEGFGFLPITCFALAMSTFVSQNLGAGQYDRVKQGTRFGIICSVITAELVGASLYCFSPLFISAFNDTPQVIAFGVAQARTVTPFFFLLAFSHSISGILRGAGKASVTMVVMLVCWCLIRVSYITIGVRLIPDIRVIFWAYPITWCLSSVTLFVYFLRADWMHGFRR